MKTDLSNKWAFAFLVLFVFWLEISLKLCLHSLHVHLQPQLGVFTRLNFILQLFNLRSLLGKLRLQHTSCLVQLMHLWRRPATLTVYLLTTTIHLILWDPPFLLFSSKIICNIKNWVQKHFWVNWALMQNVHMYNISTTPRPHPCPPVAGACWCWLLVNADGTKW